MPLTKFIGGSFLDLSLFVSRLILLDLVDFSIIPRKWYDHDSTSCMKYVVHSGDVFGVGHLGLK